MSASELKRIEIMNAAKNSTKYINLLSQLLLAPDSNGASSFASETTRGEDVSSVVSRFSPQDFGELWSLANSHHVIARAFPVLHQKMIADAHDQADWVDHAIVKERSRIQNALAFLFPICEALKAVGDTIVIKSLDHWPDLGNDLDLYTNAEPADVVAIMQRQFKADPDARSWGDRLANKWNFVVPGLPELVEVHISRLGQTGEQVAITNSLVSRSRTVELDGHPFRVAAPEDRLIISTLQRMYRHFYLRLCDVIDNSALVDSASVDYTYLRNLAKAAGLWDGLATYLVMVSGYVKTYRGADLPLPKLVTDAAHFGNELVHFQKNSCESRSFPSPPVSMPPSGNGFC